MDNSTACIFTAERVYDLLTQHEHVIVLFVVSRMTSGVWPVDRGHDPIPAMFVM
jgi:hypothetical protein